VYLQGYLSKRMARADAIHRHASVPRWQIRANGAIYLPAQSCLLRIG
jgi:hypothetical protein